VKKLSDFNTTSGLLLIGSASCALVAQFFKIPYLWAISGVIVLMIFVVQPFFFLLLFLTALPFSYLVSAGPETSILKPIGAMLIVCALPVILSKKMTLRLRISPLGVSILFFILAGYLSIFSFIAVDTAIWGFVFFLGNAIFYGICISFIDSMSRLKAIMICIYLAFCTNAVIGFLQKVVLKIGFRALGTVHEPNYFALMLLPFVPLALFKFWSEKDLRLKIFFGITALVFILTIPLTLSRSGIITLMVMLLIVFVYRRKFKQLFLLSVALIIVFILMVPTHSLIGLRWHDLTSSVRMLSVDFRFSILTSALRMFLDHPLIGIGADNFMVHFTHYSLLPPIFIRASAHNSYLEILTGMGLIGFIPYGAIIYFSFKNYWKAFTTFRLKGDEVNAAWAEGSMFGFLAFVVGIFFLTAQHHVLFWFFVALSTIFARLSREAPARCPT
jgi:O-antigen ligase